MYKKGAVVFHMIIMGALLLIVILIAALILLIRFYPYRYNFNNLPKTTFTNSKSNTQGDPINIVFIGSKEELTTAFLKADWLVPDPVTIGTSEKIAIDSLLHKNYPKAPISNLFEYGRVQDLYFEKPTNDVQRRDHIRIWNTGEKVNGNIVWIGQASYDWGIEISARNREPTHHISPAIDIETSKVMNDLMRTRLVRMEGIVPFTTPVLYAQNGSGDYYIANGDIAVINFTTSSITVINNEGIVSRIKNDTFYLLDNCLIFLENSGMNTYSITGFSFIKL